MRTTIIYIALCFGICNAGQAQSVTFDGLRWSSQTSAAGTNAESSFAAILQSERILPEDFVQDSIHLVRFTTNSFAVRFTYTEAGAKKALAFWEAHSSPGAAYSAQWKDGWLKRRTDKVFFKTEESAKSFIAEIKSK